MTQRSIAHSTPRRPAPGHLRLARAAGLALAIVFVATGCGKLFKKDKDALEGKPVEEIYQVAHESMTHSNWARAETDFRKLIAQYPYGPYTEQAMMETT